MNPAIGSVNPAVEAFAAVMDPGIWNVITAIGTCAAVIVALLVAFIPLRNQARETWSRRRALRVKLYVALENLIKEIEEKLKNETEKYEHVDPAGDSIAGSSYFTRLSREEIDAYLKRFEEYFSQVYLLSDREQVLLLRHLFGGFDIIRATKTRITAVAADGLSEHLRGLKEAKKEIIGRMGLKPENR